MHFCSYRAKCSFSLLFYLIASPSHPSTTGNECNMRTLATLPIFLYLRLYSYLYLYLNLNLNLNLYLYLPLHHSRPRTRWSSCPPIVPTSPQHLFVSNCSSDIAHGWPRCEVLCLCFVHCSPLANKEGREG